MMKSEIELFIENEYKKRRRRLTVATRQIIYFLQKSETALTQQEILKKIQKKNPNINVTTVYRVLDRLIEIKAVHKIEGKFTICTNPTKTDEAHHFAVCEKCQKYEEIFLDYNESISGLLKKEKGFHFSYAHMVFYGKCKDCFLQEKKREEG